MDTKVLLGVVATAIAVMSYIPYVRDVRSGKTKPHGFSWLIWALLAYIAGTAQLAGGGGFGAVVTLVTATISLWIAFISIRGRTVAITRGDWISLAAGLAAIPLWVLTREPLPSVALVSFIDLVGFWPTIRKSYHAPHGETSSTYWLSTIKHCLSVAAQQRYNLVTVLYPGSLALITLLFVVMLAVRKRSIRLPDQLV
jgi:hypothetical protein